MTVAPVVVKPERGLKYGVGKAQFRLVGQHQREGAVKAQDGPEQDCYQNSRP